jgi:ABC-type phosphate/phosphonate transport system permease subunit
VWFTERFHEPNFGSVYYFFMRFSRLLQLFSIATISTLSAVMVAIPAHATTASSEGTEFYVTFDYHYVASGGALERLLYLSTRSSGCKR